MATLLLGRFAWRTAALVACETMLIVLVVGSAVYAQDASSLYRLAWVQRALLISVLCQLCLYWCDSYDHKIAADLAETAIRIAQALGVASILLAITFLLDPRLVIERGASSSVTVIILGGLIVWRRVFAAVNGALRPRERLLIVGTGDAAGDLASDLLVRGAAIGVEVVGFLLSDDCPRDEVPAGVPVLGSLRSIANVVEKHQVTQLVISFADARGRLPMDDLLALRLGGVGIDHIATIYEKYTGRVAVENLRPSWLIFSPGFRHTRTRELLKRAFDITSAVVGLVLALPVMVLVALAVRATSPGAVLYRQPRVGHKGRVFTLYKFRSMRSDAEAATGPRWADVRDKRLTPIGQMLRSTRLDELPQLWNVLCGEMSLVGPRPERPEFVSMLAERIPFYLQRHSVKPGLTGWAQVRYAYGASIEDSVQKLQYDLFYIKYTSLALDMIIMFQTVKTILLRQGQ